MPISSRVNRPLERRGAGGPLAELSIGVNGALEDAGEEHHRVASRSHDDLPAHSHY
jgi:hypothetical protein